MPMPYTDKPDHDVVPPMEVPDDEDDLPEE
jgi:hypothetical protein